FRGKDEDRETSRAASSYLPHAAIFQRSPRATWQEMAPRLYFHSYELRATACRSARAHLDAVHRQTSIHNSRHGLHLNLRLEASGGRPLLSANFLCPN